MKISESNKKFSKETLAIMKKKKNELEIYFESIKNIMEQLDGKIFKLANQLNANENI